MAKELRVNTDRPWLKRVFEGFISGTPFGWVASDRALRLQFEEQSARHLGEISDSLRQVLRKVAEGEPEQDTLVARTHTPQLVPQISSDVTPLFQVARGLAGTIAQASQLSSQRVQDAIGDLAGTIEQASHLSSQRIQDAIERASTDSISESRRSSGEISDTIANAAFAISASIAQIASAIVRGHERVAQSLDKYTNLAEYQGTSSLEVVMEEIESLNLTERDQNTEMQRLSEGLALAVQIGEIALQEAEMVLSVKESQSAAFLEGVERRRKALWQLANQRMASGDSPKDGRDIGLKKALLNFSAHQAALRVLRAKTLHNPQKAQTIEAQVNQYRDFIRMNTGVTVDEVEWQERPAEHLGSTGKIAGILAEPDHVQSLLKSRIDTEEIRTFVARQPSHPLHTTILKRLMGSNLHTDIEMQRLVIDIFHHPSHPLAKSLLDLLAHENNLPNWVQKEFAMHALREDSSPTLRNRALALLCNNAFLIEGGREYIARALNQPPSHPDVKPLLRHFANARDLDSWTLEKLFTYILHHDPSPELRYRVAQSLCETREPDDVRLKFMTHILNQPPSFPFIMPLLEQLAGCAKDYNWAQEKFVTYILHRDPSPKLRFGALQLLKKQIYGNCNWVKNADFWLGIQPSVLEKAYVGSEIFEFPSVEVRAAYMYLQLARCHLAQGHFSKAMEAMKEAKKYRPKEDEKDEEEKKNGIIIWAAMQRQMKEFEVALQQARQQ